MARLFMKKILFLSVAMLAAALFLPACSSTTPSSDGNAALMRRFKQVDKNNDGRVTRDEFVDMMIVDAFARYDKSKDGSVTLEEYTALGGSPKAYRTIDRTRAGKVTLADAKASKLIREQMAQPFDEANAATGKKGYVTYPEFIAFRATLDGYVR